MPKIYDVRNPEHQRVYLETYGMPLVQTMPTLYDKQRRNFDTGEYHDSRAFALKDKTVVKEYSAFDKPWPGNRKNVFVFYELDTGHLVGVNENTSRGINYEVIKKPSNWSLEDA